MKFKPNKEKIIAVAIFIAFCLYLTWLPAEFVEYGLEHNKTEWGFNVRGPTPFHEAYSAFMIVFLIGNAFFALFSFALWWLIKEMFFTNEK